MPRTLYDLLNTLFLRCKKNTFEQRYIGDLYTRASENASEKSANKTRSGVSPEQRTPRQDQKMKKCVTCKSKNPGDSTHRKWHHERDPERPAPTRQPKKRFVKKTCFFFKNVCFSV